MSSASPERGGGGGDGGAPEAAGLPAASSLAPATGTSTGPIEAGGDAATNGRRRRHRSISDHDRHSPAGVAAGENRPAGPAGAAWPRTLDREKTCPLLLRVFCSTSRHNPIQEYHRGKLPANELQIYTWMDATLKELTSLVREVNPEARRRGTFFDFALVFPSPSGNRGARNNTFMTRDIGTTVSGQKGPDDSKTLKDCRFVIGDYMDIAITPPSGGRGGFGERRGGFGGGRDRFRPY